MYAEFFNRYQIILKSASKKSVRKNTLAFGYRLPKSV
jgi:hypothetical protein